MVGTGHTHTALIGMHQGNAGDLLDDTQRWISNLSGEMHQQEVDLLRQNSEVKES